MIDVAYTIEQKKNYWRGKEPDDSCVNSIEEHVDTQATVTWLTHGSGHCPKFYLKIYYEGSGCCHFKMPNVENTGGEMKISAHNQ